MKGLGEHMSEPLVWHTEQRAVKDLEPMQNNPRRLTSKQKDDLAASLTKFNLMSIPVINTDNTIVSGHQRMKIMILLGRADEIIDVRVPNRMLTQEEVKEACIRENRNLGEWDWDVLTKEFPSVDLLKWGFDDLEFGKASPTMTFSAETLGVGVSEQVSGSDRVGMGEPQKPTPTPTAEKEKEEKVRLVQLFLAIKDHELFMESVTKLQSSLGVDNITDAVFLTVQEAATKLGGDV